METLKKLYDLQKNDLKKYWKIFPFAFFNPSMPFFKSKAISNAINHGERKFFIEHLRNSFLPGETDKEITKRATEAMDKGIKALNFLCGEYLGDHAKSFVHDEINKKIDLFEFVKTARKSWIDARNGKRLSSMSDKDFKKLIKSYESIRAWGLGYWIFMIDESPEVLNSLRNYELTLDWFKQQFNFRKPKIANVSDHELTHSWETDAKIKIYGTGKKPIRSRIKILNSKGKLKYASILLKLLLKQAHIEKIKDFTAVEFIVENDEEKKKLVNFFRKKVKRTWNLESFKEYTENTCKKNSDSSNKFNCTKFILRPPIPIPKIKYHGRKKIYERISVEVMILTLDGNEKRNQDPDANHKQYKTKQFLKAFPILFPKQIYFPNGKMICGD